MAEAQENFEEILKIDDKAEESLMIMAMLAEQCEKYDDMMYLIRTIVDIKRSKYQVSINSDSGEAY